MTVFVLASLAIVLVLVALALRPLWTGARRSALALALALGVGTAGLYALLGTPDALDPAQVKAPETLEEAIVQLERRLADEPGSVEGWVLLGRSHAAQGNWTAAADAFGKAQALLPEEPDLMVELADARMRAAPAAFGEQQRSGLTNATARACDQYHLILHVLHVTVLIACLTYSTS